jgi:hypothetical protein
MKLEEIISKYGVPDPKIVGKLPKGGMQLDFVGHADVTKMLIEIDPEWTWEPTAFDANGLPAYRVENGMAHMAGWLTILGVRRLGVGSVMHNKPDLLKELISDFIRNASMRFGVCLSLWTKQEWDDVSYTSSTPSAPKPAIALKDATISISKASSARPDPLVSMDNIKRFVDACKTAGLNHEHIAKSAKIDLADLKESQMPQLREAFAKAKELASHFADEVATEEEPLPPEVMDDFNPAFKTTQEAVAAVINMFSAEEVIAESKANHPANGSPQIKEPGAPATAKQIGMFRALASGKGMGQKAEQLSMASDSSGRVIGALEELTKSEISELITILKA